MASQASFGSRLDRAKKILVHISTFPGYNPPVEQSVAIFSEFLASIEQHNADAASKAHAYSTAVEMRQKNFEKDDNSLYKIAGNITAAVSSQFGKKSKQAAAIKVMAAIITGTKLKKPPKPPATTGQEEITDAKIMSQSESGCGNMLKTFADMIATVKDYGATYTPGNPTLTAEALQARFVELSNINRDVTVTYSVLKQNRFERVGLYVKLADLVQRIKNAVKSQYGVKSVQFILIKGISV